MSSLFRQGPALPPASEGILARVAQSSIVARGRDAAADGAVVVKKLLQSTGKAAWIAGTTLLVLVVPLIIIDTVHEQQMYELDLQRDSILGTQIFDC